MIFLFLDESGDMGNPFEKGENEKLNVNSAYFVLAGLAVEEERLPVFERRLESLKRNFFGLERYDEFHHELKAKDLFGPRYVTNPKRQKFAIALAKTLQELRTPIFTAVFDKRNARPFDMEEIDPPAVKPWFYGLDYQRILPPIHDFITANYEKNETGVLVFDQHGLDKELAKQIVMYLCGNRDGRELRNLSHFALYGISEHLDCLQWADFIAGAIRYWFEYNYAPNEKFPALDNETLRHLDAIWKIVRNLCYFRKVDYDEQESIRGFQEIF